MAAAVAVPKHKLSESPNSRAIEIFDWTVRPNLHRGPLRCPASIPGHPASRDAVWTQLVTDQAPPDRMDVCISRGGRAQGRKERPTRGRGRGVKVGYADAWLKSRTGADSQIPMPEMITNEAVWSDVHDDLRWQFRRRGVGQGTMDTCRALQCAPLDPHRRALTSRSDPVRRRATRQRCMRRAQRVMPTCIFILSRFTLRVDNVLFRAHDTRIYHSFASAPPLVIREASGWEAPYERVKRALPWRDDLMPLTDSNLICKTLSDMPKETSQEAGAGTGWRGLGTVVQVTMLQP